MPAQRTLLLVLMTVVLATVGATPPGTAQPLRPQKKVMVPPHLPSVDFAALSDAQFEALGDSEVFYFFGFTDRTTESGITFLNQCVDDGGKYYKAVHYDHGNGIAVADIDGDGLHDIYFTNQVGANEMWRNLGDGKFEDVTAKAGVALEDRISVAGSFADIDNDGDQDLFVTTVKMGNALFENDGQGVFTDITKQAGLTAIAHSSAAVFFDYDLDGLLDLLVVNVGVYTTDRTGADDYFIGVEQAFSGHLFPTRTEISFLYRNLGNNRFVDVTRDVGLADGSWSGDAAVADLNNDRYPDLYLLNMQGDDHFYINQEGERFIDKTDEYFPATPWGAMGIKFFDFDNDADLDLMLTDMHSDMSEKIGPEREKLKSRMQWSEDHLQGGADNIFGNAFFRNLGGGKFEEVSDEVGAENYWPWGLSVADLNADGFEDVFITAAMNYPFRYGVNSVLLNDGGQRFHDSAFVLGVEPRKDEKVSQPWFDLDCAGEDSEHRHCAGEEGALTVHGAVGSRSSALFDLDSDGDLDIVTNEFNGPPLVLVSDLAEQTDLNFLSIRLIGQRSNRDGLGALVTVSTAETTQTRIHDGKSGYLSQSSLPLYFGLGKTDSVEKVEVRWPSGVHQILTENIKANQLLTIEEESVGGVGAPSTVCQGPKTSRAHAEVRDPRWVPVRHTAQQIMARDYTTNLGFHFVDRIDSSGIRFRHRIVEDAGKEYKAVHYDHGNGVASADVNGDGLLDIYFTTQIGENELWLSTGDGVFRNVTSDAGVGVGDRISVSASFGDIDNDGDPDLFVTTVRQGNLLFENLGDGRFTDISSQAGVDHVGHSSGSVFFDYDRDGFLDLFVTNIGRYTKDEKGPGDYWIGLTDAFGGHLHPDRSETSILYRNLGNRRFEDVSERTGLIDSSWSGDASPIDLNQDGWPDLYVLSMQGHDEYYENVNGERFVKRSREIFPRTPWGTMGIRVFDFDNDGLMDIYLTDMHTDMIQTLTFVDEKKKMPRQRPFETLNTDGNHVLGNAFFHNQGGGRFSEVSDQIGAENFWPWGLSSGDLNADGWEDVFITSSMNYPWRYGVNSLLLNQNGERFVDAEYLLGIEPRKGGRTAKPWFELDCSGADKEHNECQDAEGCVLLWGALGSRSSLIFDIDEDGDLDIVTNDFNSEPMVLVSDLAERQSIRFLKINLIGTDSNRSGIGARVAVRTGSRTLTKVNDGKSGYLSQSDVPVYFGLGNDTGVDQVEVLWPSGTRQVIDEAIVLNQLLVIEEEILPTAEKAD
jgi:hypothetical protein